MPLVQFLADAASAGCSRDQVQNFLRAGLILQPRQLAASAAARLCDRPDGPTSIGFGGARGGGKSHWLVAQMGDDDYQRVPELKCLLLRKVGKSNDESFADLRLRVLKNLPHTFAPSRGLLTFANGSRIITGHFQHESDIDEVGTFLRNVPVLADTVASAMRPSPGSRSISRRRSSLMQPFAKFKTVLLARICSDGSGRPSHQRSNLRQTTRLQRIGRVLRPARFVGS